MTEFGLKQKMPGDKATFVRDICKWSYLPVEVKDYLYLTISRECFSFSFLENRRADGE